MFEDNFENFRKFSQKFPIICGFRPNAQKVNARFSKSFEKYAKIMHLSQFWKFFENFRKFYQNFICIFRNFLKKFIENFIKISYAKIMYFSNFLKKFFKNFRKVSPRQNPGYAHAFRWSFFNCSQKDCWLYLILELEFSPFWRFSLVFW